jgi:DNA topoisomerase IA
MNPHRMSDFLRALLSGVISSATSHAEAECLDEQSAERSAPRPPRGVSSPKSVARTDEPTVRAAPRVAAVEPALLAGYWRAALDYTDFKKFGRDRGKYVRPIATFGLDEISSQGTVDGEALGAGDDVHVVLALWESDEQGPRPEGRRHFLLAVPARCTEEKFLLPRTDCAPVINPAYLSPDVEPECFAIAERLAADSTLLNALETMVSDSSLVPGWSIWWNTSYNALRGLVGAIDNADMLVRLGARLRAQERLRKPAQAGRARDRARIRETSWTLTAAVYSADAGGTKAIRAVFAAADPLLRREPGRLKLFERLCGTEDAHLVSSIPGTARRALVGHMDEFDTVSRTRDLHALDPAQRLAVTAILSLEDGELQAVNGPPGSGKTSMLRAVVASRWVSAALANAACPITVACGATNQSVTNVIGAFGNAPHPDASLPHAQRWIADTASYGAYLPASSALDNPNRKAELERYVCLKSVQDRGFPFAYWNRPNPLEPMKALEYEQRYLEHARRALGSRELAAVEGAVQLVWKRLRAVDAERLAFSRMVTSGGRWRELATGAIDRAAHSWSEDRVERAHAALERVSKREADAAEDIMDLVWRADAFHWAGRYWEGRFLLAQRERLLSRHALNVEEALRRICMLTPCVVGTLHSIPRLCEIDSRLVHPADPLSHVPALFDLLVVDEAGQASPELAAAAFVLARRAAVIGDVKQLEPIWNNTALSELAIAAHVGAAASLPSIIQARRSVASGSILAAARLVSRWREPEDLGVALRFHYRCKPSIIAYCNTLSYEGRLKAQTKEDDDGPEPPLAWVSVRTQPTRAGGSWVNQAEADEVASWVVERWPVWRTNEKTKDKPLQEIVALITPYRPQAQRLERALVAAFERARSSGGEGWPSSQDLRKVVIGTVHRLQGAERPIVCFSLVEGPEQAAGSFVDGDATLLNVAVSRAKRSFLVFANPDRLFPASLVGEAAGLTEEAVAESIARLTPTHQLGAHLRLRAKAAPLYPKRLVLIEAVHKRETLELMLGKQSAVLATAGALTKLVPGEGVDVRAGFAPRPIREANAAAFCTAAKDALEDLNEVVLATDDDRMGEYISWQILRLLRAEWGERKLQRVRLGAITRRATNAALAAAGRLDERKVLAEAVREVVDCLITERFATALKAVSATAEPSLEPFARTGSLDLDHVAEEERGNKPLLVGRVQAAILRLLVQRAREVVQHEELSRVLAVIRIGDVTLIGEVRAADGRATTSRRTAPQVLERLAGATLFLHEAPSVLRERAAVPEAGTISLMAEAWRRWGMTPWQTHDALQALYDGSWLRTALRTAGDSAAFEPDDPIEPKRRQGHPAVTPLDRAAAPEQVASAMISDDCRHAYSLVWDRFQLAEAGPYSLQFADLELGLAGRIPDLRVSVRAASCSPTSNEAQLNRGCLRELLLGCSSDSAPRNDAEALIDSWPDLEGLQPELELTAADAWDVTLDRLLLDLEEARIGRPSTLARALRSMVDKRLIKLPAGRGALRLTTRGFATALALEAAAPELSAPEFSASLADQLDTIEAGTAGPREVLASLAHHFMPQEAVRALEPRIWNSLAELEAAIDGPPLARTPEGGLVRSVPDERGAIPAERSGRESIGMEGAAR